MGCSFPDGQLRVSFELSLAHLTSSPQLCNLIFTGHNRKSIQFSGELSDQHPLNQVSPVLFLFWHAVNRFNWYNVVSKQNLTKPPITISYEMKRRKAKGKIKPILHPNLPFSRSQVLDCRSSLRRCRSCRSYRSARCSRSRRHHDEAIPW